MGIIKLSKDFSIDAVEYASQGNAILGIRDSGKTYTATLMAERLMDNNIPFIAFDPIGVWRYLKVGMKGKKGYPIVVAGDNGDLPLTALSAPDIVRSAMKENISLVIDLYSMSLSKNDWKKIVEQCIRLLLYENKNCGLRHIFIEEASEFCPQRVRPDEGRVYAEIEKLARMGGNASLGYTLINQRAEEVNKAVLELCDCLFLHRQKGRNSLTALGKWLDIADAKGAKGIIKSLPSLEQGECWAWSQGSHKPELITVPKKQSVHPDRRNPLIVSKGVTMDVSQFVAKLKKSMVKIEEVKKSPLILPKNEKAILKDVTQIKKLIDTISQQNSEITQLKSELSQARKKILEHELWNKDAIAVIDKLSHTLAEHRQKLYGKNPPPLPSSKTPIIAKREIEINNVAKAEYIKNPSPMMGNYKKLNSETVNGELAKGEKAVLIACGSFTNGLLRTQITVLTQYARSSRDTYLHRLKIKGYISTDGDKIQITNDGVAILGDDYKPLPTGDALMQHWLNTLPKGEKVLLELIAGEYPNSISREELTNKTGYARSSRDTYLHRMASKEIIETNRGEVKASQYLF